MDAIMACIGLRPMSGLFDSTPKNRPSVLGSLQGVAEWIRTLGENEPSVLGRSFGRRHRADWRKVAGDVRLRKTLILDAAKDLEEGIKFLERDGLRVCLHRFELDRVSSMEGAAGSDENAPAEKRAVAQRTARGIELIEPNSVGHGCGRRVR